MLLKINENLVINTKYILSITKNDYEVLTTPISNELSQNKTLSQTGKLRIIKNENNYTIEDIKGNYYYIDEKMYNYLKENLINEPKL